MTIINKKNKKDMRPPWQWANVYDIFMSTYLTNHQSSVLELIKYKTQFGFQAAKSYGESFRKVRQFTNLE